MAEALQQAVLAKKPEEVARAYAALDEAEPVELRLLCAACNLLSFHRHNAAAFSVFERGLASAHAQADLPAAGLNLNALLYATCREPTMLESARKVWTTMSNLGTKLELEPLEKMISSCLKNKSHREAFSIFLAAIDAGLKPSPRVCIGLITACYTEPQLAPMSYAVFCTMKENGNLVPPEVALQLAGICLHHDTLEHALEVYDSDSAGGRSDAALASKLVEGCAAADSAAMLQRGICLLQALRRANLVGSSSAYDALIRAQCRLSLARSRPAPARAAHALLEEMIACGHTPQAAARSQLLLACSRAKLQAEAIANFEALVPTIKYAVQPGAQLPYKSPAHAVEATALRALAVMLAAAVNENKTDSPEIAGMDNSVNTRDPWRPSASLVSRLLLAHGAALEERLVRGSGDREHGVALISVCCSCSLFSEACDVFFILAGSGIGAAAPGPSHLGELLGGCSRTAAGVEAAAALLPRLARLSAAAVARLAPSRCGEIWTLLVDASCRTRCPNIGFRVYRELVDGKFEPEAEVGLRLLLALSHDAHRSDEKGQETRRAAFELRAMLLQRGVPIPEEAGGEHGPFVEGDVDISEASTKGGRDDELASPMNTEPGLTANEDTSARSHPSGSDRESVQQSGSIAPRQGEVRYVEQQQTLLRLLDEASSAQRWDGAVETVRQLSELPGGGAPEEILMMLSSKLFQAGKAQHAVAILEHSGSAGAATSALTLATIRGLLATKTAEHTVQALSLYATLRASGEDIPLSLLVSLCRAALRATMLGDAEALFRHVAHARESAAALESPSGGKRKPEKYIADLSPAEVEKTYRRIASDLMRSYTSQLQLPQAFRLFQELNASETSPSLSLLSPLLEKMCARAMGPQAQELLTAIAEHEQPLSVKQVGEVMVALLRASRPLAAYDVFEKYLEKAGGPGSLVPTLRLLDKSFNLEHALALLTKALSKNMYGRRAHRVYTCARTAGLISNYSAFGLAALALACVEDRLLSQAVQLCSDARNALLPMDEFVASRILASCADARLVPLVVQLVGEVQARRLSFDIGSLRAAHFLLRDHKPPKLDEAAIALEILAANLTKPSAEESCGEDSRRTTSLEAGGSLPMSKEEVRQMGLQMVEALCGATRVGRALALMRTLSDMGVLPLPGSFAAIASAASRVRDNASLMELVELLAQVAPCISEMELSESISAASASGADTSKISQAATTRGKGRASSAPRNPTEVSVGNVGVKPTRKLSVGAGDLRAERAALDGVSVQRLQRDRSELQARVAQLTTLLARRTRVLERVRLEIPEAENILSAADAVEAAAADEETAEGEAALAELDHASGGGSRSGGHRRVDNVSEHASAELEELHERYNEMMRVARERQDALAISQSRAALLERRVAALRRQLKDAGLVEEANEKGVSERAHDLDQRVFSDVADSSWFKPPAGWPTDVQFTNQLLWDEVPSDLHFFRHKIADPGAVRRKYRTEIKKITSRKHPCYGAYGLYAGEEIPKGEELFDYTGHVRLVACAEHDTSTSSYLLNLFTHEESQVFIDIDAARAGNESRFLNDHHGICNAPNAQFWPYFDITSGEKRMAVKTIAPIPVGAEIVVDYGGGYFQRDSSDDSDMHDSDEEFNSPRKKRRGGGRAVRKS